MNDQYAPWQAGQLGIAQAGEGGDHGLWIIQFVVAADPQFACLAKQQDRRHTLAAELLEHFGQWPVLEDQPAFGPAVLIGAALAMALGQAAVAQVLPAAGVQQAGVAGGIAQAYPAFVDGHGHSVVAQADAETGTDHFHQGFVGLDPQRPLAVVGGFEVEVAAQQAQVAVVSADIGGEGAVAAEQEPGAVGEGDALLLAGGGEVCLLYTSPSPRDS